MNGIKANMQSRKFENRMDVIHYLFCVSLQKCFRWLSQSIFRHSIFPRENFWFIIHHCFQLSWSRRPDKGAMSTRVTSAGNAALCESLCRAYSAENTGYFLSASRFWELSSDSWRPPRTTNADVVGDFMKRRPSLWDASRFSRTVHFPLISS